MKNEILSQEKFSTVLAILIASDFKHNIDNGVNILYKSHAAALERIATLEKIVDDLSVQIDRRDMGWHSERKGFNECIAELEKQLSFESDIARESISCRDKQIAELEARDKQIAELEAREKQFEDGWRNAEKRYEEQIADLEYAVKAWKELDIVNAKVKSDLRKEKIDLHNKWNDQVNQNHDLTDKIAELESRLAEHEDETEQVQINTKDDAANKAFADALSFIDHDGDGTSSAPIIHNRDEHFYQCSIQGKKHYYLEPREPLPGDLLLYMDDGIVFQLYEECHYSYAAFGGFHFSKRACKTTGYRVNENGDVVKIKRGDK